MPKSFLKSAALVAMAAYSQAHNFTDCGSEDFIVKQVYFSPDPPQKGSKWKIGFIATPNRTITEGSMKIEVSLNGRPGFSHSIDICSDEAKSDNFPGCPFSSTINITDTNPGLPKFSPIGPYEGKIHHD